MKNEEHTKEPLKKLIKGTLLLTIGSFVGKVVAVASLPILTRLYSSADFGTLAVYISTVLILSSLASLRFVMAIPLPRTDGTAMNLTILAATIIFCFSILIALCLWMWGEEIFMFLEIENLLPWRGLIVIGVLGTSIYEALNLWATRKRKYLSIAQATILQNTLGTVTKIVLGFLSIQPFGLLIGQVFSQAGGSLKLFGGFMKDFQKNAHRISLHRMRIIACNYRGFPIWRVPSQFLMVFSMQVPILMMTRNYDEETTGQFALAVILLTAPVTLIGQSAGNALYGESAVEIKNNPAKVSLMASKVQVRLLMIALAPASIVFFGAEAGFPLLFGENWMLAGQFASLLSIASVFQLSSAPLMQIFNLIDSQFTFLKINIVRAMGVSAIFWFTPNFVTNVTGIVFIYSAFMTVFYMSVSLFVLRKLKVMVRSK